MITAPVSEIFYSIQGEGPWVGVPQVFVRFSGCDVGCAYCDTTPRPGRQYSAIALWQRVQALCRRYPVHSLSLTGGEPLRYPEFLLEFLSLRAGKKPYVYLETNGILYHALRKIRSQVDIVAMDIKLPSATKTRDYWREHACFLRECRGKTVFVKAVITRSTTQQDVERAARLIRKIDRQTMLVLQPHAGQWGPRLRDKIQQCAVTAGRYVTDVRIIPQMHKLLGVP